MHPGQLLMLIIGFQNDQNIKDSLINRVSTVYAILVKPAFSHSYFCYKLTEAKIISTVKSLRLTRITKLQRLLLAKLFGV